MAGSFSTLVLWQMNNREQVMTRTSFLGFEGTDGAGTTTQAQALSNWLNGDISYAGAPFDPRTSPVWSCWLSAAAGTAEMNGI